MRGERHLPEQISLEGEDKWEKALAEIHEIESEERSRIAENNGIKPEILENLYLTVKSVKDENNPEAEAKMMSGHIRGRQVDLREKEGGVIEGVVDGKRLSDQDAEKLWKRYIKIAQSFVREQADIARALNEVFEEDKTTEQKLHQELEKFLLDVL